MLWLLGIFLALLFVVPFIMRVRKAEKQTAEADVLARKYGLKEPASLHPVVDLERCIGMGSCMAVCPEQDVLGLRDGQAFAISPARCIGHGLCEESCSVDAIQLVFGTEKRGVDLPRVKSNFETNVAGVYVVGELGGMGLIRNAFEQGRQCVEGICKEKRSSRADIFDLVIVGCGPAGLSAAITSRHRGLKFVVVEKEDVGGTVRHYPRKKVVLTSPVKIPGYGMMRNRQILKEDLVSLWLDVIKKTGLEVRTGESVVSVRRARDGSIVVESDKHTYSTARVVLAIGRRGVPRKLGIPGEAAANVAYSLSEPETYSNDRIVVVGGGDSAIEAAMALSEQKGNQVTLSYRKDRFSRLKAENHGRLQDAANRGSVQLLLETNLTRISPGFVDYLDASGRTNRIANEYVFIFAGGELPTAFLRSCGIEIDTKFGEPLSKVG